MPAVGGWIEQVESEERTEECCRGERSTVGGRDVEEMTGMTGAFMWN